MEHKFEQLKKWNDVTLDHEERNILRAHMAHVVSSPVESPESWYHRGAQYGLRMALSTFVFIVFIGGSLSAIADSALPGDPLYSFKVNVNEEVKSAFLKTSEEKVAYQKGRVESRVTEIKTLAESKSLTPAKQKTAEKALASNIASLSKELSTLSDTSTNTALSVTANLEESLQANKLAISALDDSDTDGTSKLATLKIVDGTLKKVSDQEVKILSKEIDNIASATTATNTTTTASLVIPTVTPTQTPATIPTSTPVAP